MAKPIVDGIEKDLQEQALMLRLDMLSRFGREIATRYDISSAPTTLVLDGSGEVVYRHSGVPSRGTVVAKAMAQATAS